VKKVYILPNPEKAEAIEAAVYICEKINSWGHLGLVSDFPSNSDDSQRFSDADYLCVLGGDGSIIQVARATVSLNIPIIGINFGTVGYMALLNRDNVDELQSVLASTPLIQKRMMLDIDIIRNDKVAKSFTRALNEAVMSNGPIPHLVEFDLYCDGIKIQHIRSDGIIIATPTGSSAYSMSAGGPIMDPSLSCICATPVCPHHLNARPVIFSASSILEIRNACCRDNSIYLSADGKEVFEIDTGDVIRITRSKFTVPIVASGNASFIEVLNSKL